mgnify:CR=1 FL=1
MTHGRRANTYSPHAGGDRNRRDAATRYALLPLRLVGATRAPSLSMANGQWLAFRRDVYDRERWSPGVTSTSRSTSVKVRYVAAVLSRDRVVGHGQTSSGFWLRSLARKVVRGRTFSSLNIS